MKRIIIVLLCIGLGIILILDSSGIRTAVGESVQLCLTTIIPSLFAFLALSSFVVSSGIVKSDIAIFILSMVGGYPVGAKLLADKAADPVYKKRAESMLMYCYCGSPAFLLALSDLGMYIWLSNAAACTIFAIISNIKKDKQSVDCSSPVNCSKSDNMQLFVNAAASSGAALYKICLMIIMFSVITRIMTFFGITNMFVHSFTEVTNVINLRSNPPIIAALTSFGGICIMFQVAAICGGRLNLRGFILARIPLAVLSAVICRFITQKLVIETISNPPRFIAYSSGNALASVCLLIMTLILMGTSKNA
ncbi:MAG: hypothetical protein FWF94_08500 [Oscillospiraceae bacterium]|nr:hypothetical protein [Oscillospiraceae bacterium]